MLSVESTPAAPKQSETGKSNQKGVLMSYRAIVYRGGLKAWSPSLEDLCDPALPLDGKIFA